MYPHSTKYWLAALRLPNIGPVTVGHWLAQLGDITALFTAISADLQQIGLNDLQISAIHNIDWPAIEKDLEWCQKNDCHIIPITSPSYPALLKEVPGAPLVLFVRGNVGSVSSPQLAIIGSRHPTPGGQELAEQFAFYLAKAGLTITSGLAQGIDGASHRGALRAKGQTIAVLGNGLSKIYPSQHRFLFDQILEHGAVVSEFPPFEPPKKAHFPRRNRIISGLSVGALVVEAALQSGSLITARLAAEQGREVFALPGSVHNPLARGCHQLIRQGAKLVESVEDILEELTTYTKNLQAQASPEAPRRGPFRNNTTAETTNLPTSAQQFLTYIGYETAPIDVIILRSGLTTAEVSSMLLTLELEGKVCRVPGGYTVTVGAI